MKKFLTGLLLFITHHSSAAFFTAYYPDGKKIEFPYQTMQDILDTLGVQETTSYEKSNAVVHYKRLTNKPLFVAFLESPAPLRIPEILKSYESKYKEYLFSHTFYWDLEDMRKKGALTLEYIQDAFGQSDATSIDASGYPVWEFHEYNLQITLGLDGLSVRKANVINFTAIRRNGLAITGYSVSGTDYSIGFQVGLINKGSKPIKYVEFSVTATNPVHDIVGAKVCQGVGPIEPNEEGSYKFDDAILARTAEYLSIDQIKLIYMDMTTRVIAKKEVESITLVDWEAFGQQTLR